MHCKKIPVKFVYKGQYCSIYIKSEGGLKKEDVRKGMVLLDIKTRPFAVKVFEAELWTIDGTSKSVKYKYQPVLNIKHIRQGCKIRNKKDMFLEDYLFYNQQKIDLNFEDFIMDETVNLNNIKNKLQNFVLESNSDINNNKILENEFNIVNNIINENKTTSTNTKKIINKNYSDNFINTKENQNKINSINPPSYNDYNCNTTSTNYNSGFASSSSPDKKSESSSNNNSNNVKFDLNINSCYNFNSSDHKLNFNELKNGNNVNLKKNSNNNISCVNFFNSEDSFNLDSTTRTKVVFEFMFNPEYITEGSHIIINDQLIKAYGIVTKIYK